MSTKKIQIVGGIVPQPDWNQTDETKADYIKNKPEKATIIDETSTDKQYTTAKLVYDYLSQYKHINTITEDTMIYQLNDGIYYIDSSTSANIFFSDDGYSLIDGLLFVKYMESFNTYQWMTIGLNSEWVYGCYTGVTEYDSEHNLWYCTYSGIEQENNKVSTISKKSTSNQYPSAKAVYDYVEIVKTEIQGDLDTVSALVGGAE